MWRLSPTIEVIGIGSDYIVSRERATRLLDTGRATQIDIDTIRLVGTSKRANRKEWIKKRSGPVWTMQLVDTRKVRPRNKPKHLN